MPLKMSSVSEFLEMLTWTALVSRVYRLKGVSSSIALPKRNEAVRLSNHITSAYFNLAKIFSFH